MSRRTERPYKVDGAGELAPRSAARCSAPEINGPVVQREFTFLLREACSPSPSVTAGAAASNGRCAGTGVSRGHSTESNEPATQKPDGLTTREGLNLAGRHDHRWSGPGAMKPTGRATGQRSSWQRKSAAQSARTARNRRTRTRMYGGVGAGRGNPPGDPIERQRLGLLAASAFASELVRELPATPQSPLLTSSRTTNVYGRKFSPSIDTIVSVSLRIISCFCVGVKTPSIIFTFSNGICFFQSILLFELL